MEKQCVCPVTSLFRRDTNEINQSKYDAGTLLGLLDPLKMGPTGFPETSVRKYHSTLGNISEERISQGFSLVKWRRTF
jgi:hypothetical protein